MIHTGLLFPLAMYACSLGSPEQYIYRRMRARRWRRGSMVINGQFEMRYHAKDIKAMTSCMGGCSQYCTIQQIITLKRISSKVRRHVDRVDGHQLNRSLVEFVNSLWLHFPNIVTITDHLSSYHLLFLSCCILTCTITRGGFLGHVCTLQRLVRIWFQFLRPTGTFRRTMWA